MESDETLATRRHAVQVLDRDDDKCHWSPYCDNEGEEYVTTHIGDKPYKVWACRRCRR